MKFQNYANPSGNYPSYQNNRFGILADNDVDPKILDGLIIYISQITKQNDEIFVFPHGPELYFLTDRRNATTIDSPIIFLGEKYQNEIVKSLQEKQTKYIVYNPDYSIGGISILNLSIVNNHILNNYYQTARFGNYRVLNIK